MAQIPDELVNQLLENIQTAGEQLAKAIREQEFCKEMRKITKSTVMKMMEAGGVRSVNQQERDTYAHPTYRGAVDKWMAAIEAEGVAKARFSVAEKEWESWRTICANERSVTRS